MRNWYQAIAEDFDLDLIALRKNKTVTISEKSLLGYKKSGKAPTKQPAIKGVLSLIQIR